MSEKLFNGSHAALFATVVLISMSAHVLRGQPIEVTSPSQLLVEDFDGLGSSSTAPLPAGWRIHTGTSYDFSFYNLNRSAGTTGAQVLGSGSLSGFYNFGNGENATATDRAPGFLSTGISPHHRSSLFLGMQNRTGAVIDGIHISYDVEKYRNGLVAYDLNLFYGYDGLTWTEVPEATVHYNSDTNFSVHHPPSTTSRSVSLTSLAIADQTPFYLRWLYFASTGSNSQALGVDNVRLQIGSALPAALRWAGVEGSVWDDQTANWKNGGGESVAWSDGARQAIFAGGSDITSNVSLASPRIVGSLIFDAPATTYTLSGASIEIEAPTGVGIDARSDALVQSAVLVKMSQAWELDTSVHISGPLGIAPGRTLTKTGMGAVRLSGSLDIGDEAAISVNAGALRLASNANSLHLTIEGNPEGTDSQVTLEADQDLSSLKLSIAHPGRQGLDLSSPLDTGGYRSLRIHSGDLETIKSSLHQLISHAKANPADGIYDSAAAAHNATLGVAAFPGHVLVRPTRLGDLNLDGSVTIADFIDLASHFGGTDMTWQEGDLNGDGGVTIADFIDLAANFGGAYSGEMVAITDADRQRLDAFAAEHGVALPEPGLATLALMAMVALLWRRRVESLK